MTGFGSGMAESGGLRVEVQVSSVNHRHCQVHVRGDLRDLALEEGLRRRLREALQRGSISAQVQVQSERGLAYDRQQLAIAWRELASLAAELGAPAPRLEDILRLLPRAEGAHDELPQLVEQAADTAIASLLDMRQAEGARLAAAFAEQIDSLKQLHLRMQGLAGARAPALFERLRERLSGLVTEQMAEQIDEQQLHREMAVLADRLDISEELTRLDSHIDQLQDLLGDRGDEPQGKRLEFLLQEIGREVNTSGAKANDAELSRLVVDAKSLVEQMREQAANVW